MVELLVVGGWLAFLAFIAKAKDDTTFSFWVAANGIIAIICVATVIRWLASP